ncbi:Alpha/Beta hydrolase protein [Gigaspora rosea]|uniref:Alpha/Beta hydrolase protein n=1 Tax=Gigaspora rosea TaxID=44941 RepID=A0A397W8F5_9GLOM|nr:Alpha/Beta hydrolase protein [Gigaspora rosea]
MGEFNGISALGLPIPQRPSKINFNLDIAETLLFLSTIIYERNSDDIRKAHNEIQTQANEPKARELCKNAYRTIYEKSESRGLKFLPLSELGNVEGLFAGMFWSENKKFIVVAFKGTTSTNFNEWLVDFLITRADASQYVFGGIHRGFYDNFFPKGKDIREAKLLRKYPAYRMVDVIRKKAEQIYKNSKAKSKVNIWVTGHSLGAALAQVFYARLIKTNDLMTNYLLSTKDLKKQEPFGESLMPMTVPKMPPRYAFNIFGPYVSKSDFRNYFHIGHEIKFFMDGKRPQGIVSNTCGNGSKPSNHGENNKTSRWVLPNFIRDHMADRYFIAMERSRHYFEGQS